jgi:hypothetical protein
VRGRIASPRDPALVFCISILPSTVARQNSKCNAREDKGRIKGYFNLA